MLPLHNLQRVPATFTEMIIQFQTDTDTQLGYIRVALDTCE